METNIIIYVGIYKFLGTIATLVGLTWYASHKLTKVETKIGMFETRLTGMEGRLDDSFGQGSPVKLFPKGERILVSSGLKKYVDDHRSDLVQQFDRMCVTKNQYDIQEQSFKFFDELDFGEFESLLKKSALDSGVDLATVRRIGGIYFRDIALLEAGFKPEDLDKPQKS